MEEEENWERAAVWVKSDLSTTRMAGTVGLTSFGSGIQNISFGEDVARKR